MSPFQASSAPFVPDTSRISTERLAKIRGHLDAGFQDKRQVEDVYILSAARTPTGKVQYGSPLCCKAANPIPLQFQGALSAVSAPQLGAVAIKAALVKSTVPLSRITDVYFGNVLQGGVGQAPARQASIFAGLPCTTEAVTVNKVCSSGLKAVVLAAQNIQLGLAEAQVAGGMESMSNVPYYQPRGSQMPSFGDIMMQDGLVKDGLLDVYNRFHMGVCAETTAEKLAITREVQDEYAIRSYERAQAAWKQGKFKDEVAPVNVQGENGDIIINEDEGYDSLRRDKVSSLKSAFIRNGSVTAANSSTMNDGASALVLGNKAIAREFGKGSRVLARIISSADAAIDPVDFPVAPAKAVLLALERAGLKTKDIAVWEINEAFAVVIKANEHVGMTFEAFQDTAKWF